MSQPRTQGLNMEAQEPLLRNQQQMMNMRGMDNNPGQYQPPMGAQDNYNNYQQPNMQNMNNMQNMQM